MDGKGFDALARRLATGRSRRSVLRGLVGGGAALVAVRTGTVLAASEGKTAVCHFSKDLGTYEPISVSVNAVEAHLAHGDQTCAEGEICGAQGCAAPPTGCSDAVLTGMPDDIFCVDDKLRVRVNGVEVFYHEPIFCQAEVPVGSLLNGDLLSLEIYDDYPPCSIRGYQLVCKTTGETQVLDADGFCRGYECYNGTDDWGGFGLCGTLTHTVAL